MTTNHILPALALASCAVLGFMAAVALADPVVTVVDGDSLRIDGAPVRLVGVDAPELRQRCLDDQQRSYACGEASANALRAMIERDPGVTCEARGRDRFGRTLAVCRNDGGDLAGRLVAQGWAVDFTKYSSGAYRDHEAAARAERLGMHAGSFTMPEQYRKESKR